eukprot:CAMPEP_0113636472 /NCGR_PEP_ID=MMETSP0017_2-20120614/19042_1 /TAXON_ID=2856 /ORGANISM="Cylindrotheca closterium" /LENGTH=169 /DNA_ID=CAMNT_0000547357 /DNA_START=89 /DNA_END=598 /DNA_ORIENTATION=+ /assembly_acc=CAM_ASM_000147
MNMEDYNTREQRRGSMFGSANGVRRGSLFGFHWAEDDGKSAEAHRRGSLQERYRGMGHTTRRRGSLFGGHSSENHHSAEKPCGKGRRASLFGSHTSQEDGAGHHRRGSIDHHNCRGSVGPMATLSSVTAAKSRRRSMGLFGGFNKVHIFEPNSVDLAEQVMAAFADFDV